MFTGLIEATGRIARVEGGVDERRLRIEPPPALLDGLTAGDSIAVSGACLTAVDPDPAGFWVDVSGETLTHTTLGSLDVGAGVNLERALLPTTRLGGHLVAGHVDGLGEVVGRWPEGRCWRFQVQIPGRLARYVAPKGSICIDGISLTVNEVDGGTLGVNIIPHTLVMTTLDGLVRGACVNIEVDLVARYLECLLQGAHVDAESGAGVSREMLTRYGFAAGAED